MDDLDSRYTLLIEQLQTSADPPAGLDELSVCYFALNRVITFLQGDQNAVRSGAVKTLNHLNAALISLPAPRSRPQQPPCPQAPKASPRPPLRAWRGKGKAPVRAPLVGLVLQRRRQASASAASVSAPSTSAYSTSFFTSTAPPRCPSLY